MLFSQHFNVSHDNSSEWFDPLLSSDTSLFIDPFLLFEHQTGEFAGSHDELIAYFNYSFSLVADAMSRKTSIRAPNIINSLKLPEVEEICLGYGEFGTSGRGSGDKGAGAIAGGMEKAIRAGMSRLEHFESVGLFEPGFGADKISDACAYILSHRFAKFTDRICKELGVATRPVTYRKSRFDTSKNRWAQGKFNLPMNPYNKKPILLVPKVFLRELPTINAEDFYNYCVGNENDTLRQLFGQAVLDNVKKEDIIRRAAQSSTIRDRYLKRKEKLGSEPYDTQKDKSNKHKWHRAASALGKSTAVQIDGSTPESFARGIKSLINEFKSYIEDNAGWTLLRNDNGTGRKEAASQKFFQSTAMVYCRYHNIDLSSEVNAGRGPVDFKFSQGWNRRVLIEVKLARSAKLVHGIDTQLPIYLKSERVEYGVYVVVCYDEAELQNAERTLLNAMAAAGTTPCPVEIVFIKAWKPPSASAA